MDARRFLKENRGSWAQLEHLLDLRESGGLGVLRDDQVRNLARLYRTVSSDLLIARELRGQAEVVGYLESLVGRGYPVLYAPPKLRPAAALSFFSHRWPRLLRQEWAYVAAAAAVFALGFAAALCLTLADPVAFDHLLPADWAGSYAERTDDPLATRFGDLTGDEAANFSSALMVNNIRVTLRCFVLGLTFGIGTVAALFFNGALMGAIAANFASWGQSLDFWAMILPHGVPEIFAILLGGGGGLILADALLRPGQKSRGAALRQRGLQALHLVAAAVPLLILAGLIEAFITPLASVPPVGKLIFAGCLAAGLFTWIRAPWLAPTEQSTDSNYGRVKITSNW
jgi:uncharacterized membrane protein SpoIIM required for sporulation